MAFLNNQRVRAYIDLLRWHQWIKNTFLFAAPVFSGQLFDAEDFVQIIAAFFIFCGLSSAVYIFNDLKDCDDDAFHPQKRFRPLPSGKVSRRDAIILTGIIFIMSLSLAFLLSRVFGVIALSYLFLNVLYTVWLKKIVLLDVMAVAVNYVIRVIAGALVISVPLTPWLMIASTLLALFLALGKRRHELVLLGDTASNHRSILKEYSPYFLDQLIGIVTASTVVVYSFYTIDREIAKLLGTNLLPLTIPFVLYGIFRYLYLVHQRRKGGDPAVILLNDRPLLATVATWLTVVIVLIYVVGSALR